MLHHCEATEVLPVRVFTQRSSRDSSDSLKACFR
jgi:hypothetical protein